MTAAFCHWRQVSVGMVKSLMLVSSMSLTRSFLVSRFYPLAFIRVRFPFSEILVLTVQDLFLASGFTKMGIGIACWIFGSTVCLHRIRMDPSWSEIKCILQRHEEMAEASREALLQVSGNLKGVKQTVENLTSMVRNQAQRTTIWRLNSNI